MHVFAMGVSSTYVCVTCACVCVCLVCVCMCVCVCVCVFVSLHVCVCACICVFSVHSCAHICLCCACEHLFVCISKYAGVCTCTDTFASTSLSPALCFLLPLLIRLSQESQQSPGELPRMVILSPTRELCMQIEGQAKQIAKGLLKWVDVIIK